MCRGAATSRPVCGLCIKLKSLLKQHCRIAHHSQTFLYEKPGRLKHAFACKHCHKTFTRKTVRDKHLLTRHGKRSRLWIPRVIKHESGFTGEPLPQEIETISQSFEAHDPGKVSRTSMKGHVESVQLDSSVLPCLLCGLAFQNKESLERHSCQLSIDQMDLYTMSKDSGDASSGVPEEESENDEECERDEENRESAVDSNALGTRETRGKLATYCQAVKREGRNETLYKCRFCDYQSTKMNNTKRHYECVHLGARPFSCDVCVAAFKHKASLVKHVEKEHSGADGATDAASTASTAECADVSFCQVVTLDDVSRRTVYKCASCDYRSRKLNNVKRHHKCVHLNAHLFACGICDASFKHKVSLVKHIARNHGNGEPETAEGNRAESRHFHAGSILRTGNLNRNERTELTNESEYSRVDDMTDGYFIEISDEEGARRFQCRLCSYNSQRKHNVKLHYQRHNPHRRCLDNAAMPEDSRPVRIEPLETVDDVEEARGDSLNSMTEWRKEDPTWKNNMKKINCKFCCKEFKSDQEFADHLNIHKNRRPYLCDMCGKSFTHNSYLVTHRKTHTSKQKLECSVCHKHFASMFYLRQHENIHTGNRPYSCEYCGRGFACSQNLKVHIRIHTGEKPYKCKLCEYRCVQSTSLKKHMTASHGGSYDLACDLCEKKFKFKSHLTAHKLRHTRQMRHFCEFCNKGFLFPRDLREHKRTHTNERPYKCGVCSQAFFRGTHLNQHMKNRHPGAETGAKVSPNF